MDPGIFASRRTSSSPRAGFDVLLFALNSLDIFHGQAGAPCGCGLDNAHDYALVLRQIQRLERTQRAIFIHGVNPERHAPIVS